jgi:hypothetical protein
VAGASPIGLAMRSGIFCTVSALISNLRQYYRIVSMKVGIRVFRMFDYRDRGSLMPIRRSVWVGII